MPLRNQHTKLIFKSRVSLVIFKDKLSLSFTHFFSFSFFLLELYSKEKGFLNSKRKLWLYFEIFDVLQFPFIWRKGMDFLRSERKLSRYRISIVLFPWRIEEKGLFNLHEVAKIMQRKMDDRSKSKIIFDLVWNGPYVNYGV